MRRFVHVGLFAIAVLEVLVARSARAQSAEDAPAEIPAAPRFVLQPFGFARMSYDWVRKDPNVDFVGRNNGFELRNARVGLDGTHVATGISFRLSVEGATDTRDRLNAPQGTLTVRMLDAFARYDLHRYFGIQVGQSLAPFDAENLRPTEDLLFASRALGQEGVRVGNGYEEPGMVVDRELGVLLSPKEPIKVGDSFAIGYGLMAANGNGANQLRNDNNSLGLYGRLELRFRDLVRLGGAALMNDRTVGALPNLYREKDTGAALDLRVDFHGLEVSGQIVRISTTFSTLSTDTRKRLAWHAQIGYLIRAVIPFEPAYRFAYYDPWSNASGSATSGVDLSAYRLRYHTVGVRVFMPKAPTDAAGVGKTSLYLNYTFTGEEASRRLRNDRLEILAQVAF